MPDTLSRAFLRTVGIEVSPADDPTTTWARAQQHLKYDGCVLGWMEHKKSAELIAVSLTADSIRTAFDPDCPLKLKVLYIVPAEVGRMAKSL